MLPHTEPYRPQYHFTPPDYWMNDPNGLVYLDEEFHLFYQANPAGIVWGPMHWGHAVSPDLVNWQQLPIALSPDALGSIFSGSAVVDRGNTTGFGANALVVAFTHHQHDSQRQSLAYSLDRGRTWTKYLGNPVLAAPASLQDFRDPKIFWHDTGLGAGHWVMLVAAGSRVLFYTSMDLKRWTASSSFGPGVGATEGVWETPELLNLPVDGGPAQRWVLLVGVQQGAPAGGSGTQYFVGQFDGQTFTNDNPPDTVLWADYGADFYAAQAWNDAPGARHVAAAWMNNWSYANQIPTRTWRGALTLPRELALATTPQGPRLTQQPITELQKLRGQPWHWQNVSLPATPDLQAAVRGEALEISATFSLDPTASPQCFGLRVRVGGGEQTTIGYSPAAAALFVDRTHSGQVAFGAGVGRAHVAPLQLRDGTLHLRIFVDRASVEVFANDGRVTFTDQIFPAAGSLGVEAFADGGPVTLSTLDIYPLAAAKFQADAELSVLTTDP
jgi:fructan beta-fructosidase